LAQLSNVVRWQADSKFNEDELRELGVATERLRVVPPFMTCTNFLKGDARPVYEPGGRIELLFVGRRVPNKGHRHLLHTLAAFRLLYPTRSCRLTVMGAIDDELAGYYREMSELERDLDVATDVRWLSHVSDGEIRAAFESSHVYLSLSEHEGFCVPIIEAQSLGLPVIVSDTPAVRDTAGTHQIVVPQPRDIGGYDLIAAAVHEVYCNEQLRNQVIAAGFRNVYGHFSAEHIENLFLDDIASALLPVMQ
jgi:glycosyltransferase involved in cell wall biosynthesis